MKKRERVAVVGGRGLFEETVAAALVSKRHLHVRRFALDEESTMSREIGAFKPDMIVLMGSIGQPVPQAILPQIEKGVAIVTLDPTKPTMDFSYQVREAPATLETVLRTVEAARIILSRGRSGRLTPAEREV